MNKLLKTLGIGTALVGCGVAMASWWCNRCNKYHNGRRCPAVTLGVAYDDRYDCMGGFDFYGCDDDGWDSDEENGYLSDRIQCRDYSTVYQALPARERHHKQRIERIINLIWRVNNPADLRRIREAVDDQARFHGNGYGCEGGYPYFDDWDYRAHHHFDCNPYGC